MKNIFFLLFVLVSFTSCGGEDEEVGGPPVITVSLDAGGEIADVTNKVVSVERTGGNILVRFSFSTPEGYDRSTYRDAFGINPAFLFGDFDLDDEGLSGDFVLELVGPELIPGTGDAGTFAVYDVMGQKDSLNVVMIK